MTSFMNDPIGVLKLFWGDRNLFKSAMKILVLQGHQMAIELMVSLWSVTYKMKYYKKIAKFIADRLL